MKTHKTVENTAKLVFPEVSAATPQPDSLQIRLGETEVIARQGSIGHSLQEAEKNCVTMTFKLNSLPTALPLALAFMRKMEESLERPLPIPSQSRSYFSAEDEVRIRDFALQLQARFAELKNTQKIVLTEEKAEATESIEDVNEYFESLYTDGKRTEAMKYFDKINVDYDEGIFLLRAAEDNDVELVEFLLEKKPQLGVFDALEQAAYFGHIKSTELLLNYLIKELKEDIRPIRRTEAYDHREEVKNLLDKVIEETYAKSTHIA
jgi:hypothetical protein